MRAARSNKVSPSSTMRPRSGSSRPAIMLIRLVLPPPAASKAASIAKSPNLFSTSTDSILRSVQPRGRPSRQPFRGHQRGERDDDGDYHQLERGGVAARHLRERVDRRRDGLRLARDV